MVAYGGLTVTANLYDRAAVAGVSVTYTSGCMACVASFSNNPYDQMARLDLAERLIKAGLEPVLSNHDGSIIVRVT